LMHIKFVHPALVQDASCRSSMPRQSVRSKCKRRN
jgi:hypothetical protein